MSKPIELKSEAPVISVLREVDAGHLVPLLLDDVRSMLKYEGAVFAFADHITHGEYTGGTWRLKLLSNGGFYLSYKGSKPFTLHNSGNQTERSAGGELFSLIVNAYVCSHLSFLFYERGQEELARIVGDNYHKLRDYAFHDHSPFTEEAQSTFYTITD